MFERVWSEQTDYKDDLGVKNDRSVFGVSVTGETRLYGGSWDLNIEDNKRSLDERYVPSVKRMRKSNALTPRAIIDEVLKIIPPEKRRSILMRVLQLSTEYAHEMAEQTTPKIPVNLLNASLSEFGYILFTPDECKGRNGYNEIGMVITGVARRSVDQNMNSNSTEAGEGLHTYIPKYITVSDKALMDDEHDNMFQTCISVREGVAEFEWTLTGDTHGKVATIRYNRARGKVDTTIGSILKQEYDTYFVYALDGPNPPRRIYFEATQYSDFSKESPLLEPDIVNNIGTARPYSIEEHKERHLGIVNGSTNKTLGRAYEKGVHYRDVLKSCERKQNPPCILDPPKDDTRIKIRINHLAPDLSVCNTSIVEISRVDDNGVMSAIRLVGEELLSCDAKQTNRKEAGDEGKMYSFGSNTANRTTGEYCIPDNFDPNIMKHASTLVTNAWNSLHSTVMESITTCTETARKLLLITENPITPETETTYGVYTMIYTIDLRNASHYDINDMKYSLSIWASDNPDKLRGKWFFVIPNVRVELTNGSIHDGLVIVLDDCVQILWDGRVLRHGTAYCDNKDTAGAHAFSIFATANGCHEGARIRYA